MFLYLGSRSATIWRLAGSIKKPPWVSAISSQWTPRPSSVVRSRSRPFSAITNFHRPSSVCSRVPPAPHTTHSIGYRARYPQVRVELFRRDADSLRRDCEESAFDAAFSVLTDLQDLSQYHCRKLGSDFYCLVCPKDHHCLENMVVRYDRLATEPFVCLSSRAGSFMYKQFRQICKNLGFTPRVLAEYAAMEDVIFAVECGQALTILPYHIREYMHTDLAFLPLDGDNPVIDLGMVWRRESGNPALTWLVELISHYLVEQPDLF